MVFMSCLALRISFVSLKVLQGIQDTIRSYRIHSKAIARPILKVDIKSICQLLVEFRVIKREDHYENSECSHYCTPSNHCSADHISPSRTRALKEPRSSLSQTQFPNPITSVSREWPFTPCTRIHI